MSSTVTCRECNGEGERLEGSWGGEAEVADCIHCNGSGECDCRDCQDTYAENAFSDMCESEPPLSADERHQMAWREKQGLRS